MSILKILGCLLIVVLVAGVAAAWQAGLLERKYTAKAILELKRCQPCVVSRAAEKFDPVEFEAFRATQKQLVVQRFVLAAALRDGKLNNRACIKRQDEKHNAIGWLAGEVRVDFLSKDTGLMQISATEPDADDAAAIVNAVVNAYMKEVVNHDDLLRRERLSDLNTICVAKEEEVRNKRETLKRELENNGAGDEQTMNIHTQLAMTMYSDAMREFTRMKTENRALAAKIQEDKAFLRDLPDTEIAETEIAILLNNNPIYRDLQSRRIVLESKLRDAKPAANNTEKRPPLSEAQAELAATKEQIKQVKLEATDQVRNAKRIELQQEIKHLEARAGVSERQLAMYEKEVEKKANEADSAGKTTVGALMQMEDIRVLEQMVHALAVERESLKVELNSPPRVVILGDNPRSPATVPEKPD
jgi:polysaccharide biosynthesis transport protein